MKMPMVPEFATVIVPELVRMPWLPMPVPAVFAITSVVPTGITSSSPAAIIFPSVVIVHVLVVISHVPPKVGHAVASSVYVVACAS